MGRKAKKEGTYVYIITDSFYYTADTNNIVKQLYSNKISFKKVINPYYCKDLLYSRGIIFNILS